MKNFSILVQSGFANAMILGIVAATTTTAFMGAAPAYGANFSFTGNLGNPNDLPSFLFTADGTSTVTIRSTSYANGGFDPNLTVFNAADLWYADSDDTIDLDFGYTEILPAGNYRAVIAAFGNNNISGPGSTFTPSAFDGEGAIFSGQTSAYAFDILNVTQATAVPEPSSLIGTALAVFAAAGLKRKLSSIKKSRIKY